MDKAIAIVRDAGRFGHAIYHLVFRINAPYEMPYFKSAYPSSWLGYYVQRQYSDVDSVIRHEFQMEEPFFWSDLPVCSDKQMTFLKDTHEHGVSQTGFSVPLTDRASRKALFSVDANLATPYWKAKIGKDRELPLKIGDLLHRRAIKELYGTDGGRPPGAAGD